jgi:hypothetical protein
MPIDPQDGGLDDWFVPAQPSGGADGPDDWFVPASDGYPDDWFLPASGVPGTAQPASGPPLSSANPTLTARPTARPDPLAAYWSRVPASRVGAMAWHPPIFLDSTKQFPLTVPAPLTTPSDESNTGLAQPVRCQGPTCSQGGSFGTSGMYYISGRTLCRNCAVKFLGIQDLPATEQIKILQNFPK